MAIIKNWKGLGLFLCFKDPASIADVKYTEREEVPLKVENLTSWATISFSRKSLCHEI
jgi:hypothetical protein